MQSYTFKELSWRAKIAVANRYRNEPEVSQYILANPLPVREDGHFNPFNALPWRFNEHGERIA